MRNNKVSAQKRRAKYCTTYSENAWRLMYRTSSSWSFVPITGRSSDLKIDILTGLPGYSPVTHKYLHHAFCNPHSYILRFGLPSYSDGLVQDSHLLPFSPNQSCLLNALFDTCYPCYLFFVLGQCSIRRFLLQVHATINFPDNVPPSPYSWHIQSPTSYSIRYSPQH